MVACGVLLGAVLGDSHRGGYVAGRLAIPLVGAATGLAYFIQAHRTRDEIRARSREEIRNRKKHE